MAKEDQIALKTASVLAFERKLDPSDALLYAGRWGAREQSDAWVPIDVREKSVRGTVSHRLKMKDKDIDPAGLNAEIDKPNLQRVDVATLPPDADTLKVQFTVRILGGAGIPSACNNAEYQKKLRTLVQDYASRSGYQELSRRYAHNLANGRFLWRNRMGAETVEVHICHLMDGTPAKRWMFSAQDFSLRGFDTPSDYTDTIGELVAVIASGLAGKGYAILEIVAFARMGEGQEVFPSQELILDKGTGHAWQKSRTLYTVRGVAAIHSQKLGNAIRTIDTWYPDEDGLGPIAIEPYGSVTSRGKAYRQPRQKLDFYSLLDGWMIKDQVPGDDQQHYVMANLIRGGVFGESSKD
ncbi:type I-F CRISPR-associated protein Csy3 [Paraburkholderia madseniana]|uniref:type I-F CRISPR-associated protein Csy3 n=1 Tax=Paraburkholderia madseniana TaxID=2599607 RepID=UPI0015C542A9|nr:type I-F CRISPR-associated protein Csy3 [Paraburkholderia madseniana]NPT68518.1 type I-F CRISPR-associated protein Csy3 [Paraburkholderia madseniana]